MRPVCRADNLTTFMCRLSWNPGASTSWNPQSLQTDCFLFHYVNSKLVLASFLTSVTSCEMYKSRGSSKYKFRRTPLTSPPLGSEYFRPAHSSRTHTHTHTYTHTHTHTFNPSSNNIVIHGHQTMPHVTLHFCSTLQSILTTFMALHALSRCTERSKWFITDGEAPKLQPVTWGDT
jgi:hypothetical protein